MTWHYIISEKCNMHCLYCNVDVDNNIRLDKDFFNEFVQTNLMNSEPYRFDIFGGETFLQMDILKYIVNVLKDDSNCYAINITTNGTIFNNDIEELMKLDKMRVTLSYDGIGQLNNRGSHKIYLQEFLDAGASVAHTMIVGEQFNNIQNNFLIENHEFIEQTGYIPDMTLVRDIGTWTDVQASNFIKVYYEYSEYIAAKINNDEYQEFKQLPGLIRNYINAMLENIIKKNPKQNCGCGTNFMSITPQGIITPCERFEREPDTILKFNDSSIMEACNTCEIKDICHKGCYYEQLKNDGPIKELCKIYFGIVKGNKRLIELTNHRILELFTKENL